MKTKKMAPQNVAPVKRENLTTSSINGSMVAPSWKWGETYAYKDNPWYNYVLPFAGDNAE
jgi:prenylated cyclic peptide (anacyclamide/piricyclamide family)